MTARKAMKHPQTRAAHKKAVAAKTTTVDCGERIDFRISLRTKDLLVRAGYPARQ